MQRTNICYVITKSNFGGAQKYVFELATSLHSDAFTVTVALGGEGLLKTKLEAAGIRTVVIPHLERDVSLINEFRVFFFLFNFFRRERCDVVHLNSSKIGGLGSVTAFLAGVPRIIFTAHGFAFNEQRSRVSKLFLKFLYWIIMVVSDTTIAVSGAIKEQVHGWPFVHKKIIVIHNGVKPISFLLKEVAREQLATMNPSLDLTRPWVGTIAELHPIKGLDILIDAVAEIHKTHPEYQFVVLGEGEQRTTLEKQIVSRNLKNTFILQGFTNNAATYLKAFDLLVLPSRSEALALVILEAGLAGLPVVASRVGGIPEVITDQVSGLLVPKENTQALRDALLRTLTEKEFAHNMATELHKKVSGTFSFERMLAQTIELYHRTM
jgi:glycosyltransferase involved in cell wall biosynthesis